MESKFNQAPQIVNPEKIAEWNRILSEVEKITDGRNLGVDSGIKESVAALKLNGFETTGSCEGHIDWGRRNPYVDIGFDISNDLKEKFADLKKKIEEKGIRNRHELENDPVLGTMHKQLRKEAADQARVAIPKIENNIKSLIESFYSSHKPVSKENMLVVYTWNEGTLLTIESANGSFSANSKEESDARKQKLDNLSLEERKRILEEAQAEMRAFTEFLKQLFFKE